MLILTQSLQQLPHLGILRIHGADARAFLQGQLSNDLDLLRGDKTLLASCNSPQGRVQAILRLIDRGDDAILAILPRSMLELTATRLGKYILRSKVKIEDASAAYAIVGAIDAAADLAGRYSLSADMDTHSLQDGISFVRWPDPLLRYLIVSPQTPTVAALPDGTHAWHAADIRAGLPQVYPQTHEHFIAQMLNLDLLNGISTTKGCYTGQEIIARTHFLGAIKRRMFRLQAAGPAPRPGTRILNQDRHAGDVVDAIATESGCELLAVLNLSAQDAPLTFADTPSATLTKLPLPYSITKAGNQ